MRQTGCSGKHTKTGCHLSWIRSAPSMGPSIRSRLLPRQPSLRILPSCTGFTSMHQDMSPSVQRTTGKQGKRTTHTSSLSRSRYKKQLHCVHRLLKLREPFQCFELDHQSADSMYPCASAKPINRSLAVCRCFSGNGLSCSGQDIGRY